MNSETRPSSTKRKSWIMRQNVPLLSRKWSAQKTHWLQR